MVMLFNVKVIVILLSLSKCLLFIIMIFSYLRLHYLNDLITLTNPQMRLDPCYILFESKLITYLEHEAVSNLGAADVLAVAVADPHGAGRWWS